MRTHSRNLLLLFIISFGFCLYISFRVIQSVISVARNQTQIAPSPTPLQKPHLSGDEITNFDFGECRVILLTKAGRTIKLDPLQDVGDPTTKCLKSPRIKLSNFGKYIVYEDVSGGVDSMLKVYSIEKNASVVVGVYGTSIIMDFVFLQEDVLALLNGYPGLPAEQHLTVYDIPSLFAEYDSNVNEYGYFLVKPTQQKQLALPNFEIDYSYLRVSTEALEARTNDLEKFAAFDQAQYSF